MFSRKRDFQDISAFHFWKIDFPGSRIKAHWNRFLDFNNALFAVNENKLQRIKHPEHPELPAPLKRKQEQQVPLFS